MQTKYESNYRQLLISTIIIKLGLKIKKSTIIKIVLHSLTSDDVPEVHRMVVLYRSEHCNVEEKYRNT